MHPTLSTTDRTALHNPFALFLSSRLHIREGVKTEPIITQGNQAIWHADQWMLDWWVSYLDEQVPRGTVVLPYCCHGDRDVGGGGGVCNWGWQSRSPRGHSSDAMHQTNIEGIIWQHLTAVWRRFMQNRYLFLQVLLMQVECFIYLIFFKAAV